MPGVGTNRYAYSFNDPVNKMDPGGNEYSLGLSGFRVPGLGAYSYAGAPYGGARTIAEALEIAAIAAAEGVLGSNGQIAAPGDTWYVDESRGNPASGMGHNGGPPLDNVPGGSNQNGPNPRGPAAAAAAGAALAVLADGRPAVDNFDVEVFERGLVRLNASERVAVMKDQASNIAEQRGWLKDGKVMRLILEELSIATQKPETCTL